MLINFMQSNLHLRLKQMLYYALCLSYHHNTEAVLFACLSSGWATATGRRLGPKVGNGINGRILKANLRWSPTRAKFCQLIASLSVVLPQINLTKLKFEYLKFGFSTKKKDINTDKKFLCHSSLTFFRVQLKFAFKIRP